MEIIWLNQAKKELYFIFEFYAIIWSEDYAEKLIYSILDATEILEKFPEIGQTELSLISKTKKYRYLIYSHFKIIYWINNHNIKIVDIFDTRQNPEKLNLE